jgi:hypothetical protein
MTRDLQKKWKVRVIEEMKLKIDVLNEFGNKGTGVIWG